MLMIEMAARRLAVGGVVLSVMVLAGCAANGAGGPMSMSGGQNCKSVRAELNKLDARGVRSKIEAQERGQRLSSASRSQVDRYNQLLNVYLGSRCHT